MLKKTITYKDYNGVERTEDFYFNLTEAELMKMEWGTAGGIADTIQAIVKAKDNVTIVKLFEDIIAKAYGKKSPDGRRFIKNQEVLDDFQQTEAYSKLYMELATNEDAAAEFINGVIPEDLAKRAQQNQALEATDNVFPLPQNLQ